MSDVNRMDEMSGEPVETDGIYENEWGRQVYLMRGEPFPADPQLGTTIWKLVSLAHDTHTGWTPDSRFREEPSIKDGENKHYRFRQGDQY